jgi:hypothetical protein
MRKPNEKVTKMKYWLHLYIDSSGELGSFIVARSQDQASVRLDHFAV